MLVRLRAWYVVIAKDPDTLVLQDQVILVRVGHRRIRHARLGDCALGRGHVRLGASSRRRSRCPGPLSHGHRLRRPSRRASRHKVRKDEGQSKREQSQR